MPSPKISTCFCVGHIKDTNCKSKMSTDWILMSVFSLEEGTTAAQLTVCKLK